MYKNKLSKIKNLCPAVFFVPFRMILKSTYGIKTRVRQFQKFWSTYMYPARLKEPQEASALSAEVESINDFLQNSKKIRCLLINGTGSVEHKMLWVTQAAASLDLPLCILGDTPEQVKQQVVKISPETGEIEEYGEILKTIQASGILVCKNLDNHN